VDDGGPAMKLCALVVDADTTTRLRLRVLLGGEGLDVVEASSVTQAASELARLEGRLDLLVLDPVLPDGDGLTLLGRLRETSETPVLILSADEREVRRVEALDLGADDVVLKPFRQAELAARVRAMLRRWSRETTLRAGPLVVDPATRLARLHEVELDLRPREFDLLAHFLRHPGVAHSREELLQAVWGSSTRWQLPSTVTEHVRRLRQKLGAVDPSASEWFTAVRGLGYRFEPPR
jgi:DNA-binding response OmpR family regulator